MVTSETHPIDLLQDIYLLARFCLFPLSIIILQKEKTRMKHVLGSVVLLISRFEFPAFHFGMPSSYISSELGLLSHKG